MQSDGRSGQVKQLSLELTVLDDLSVDREGILVADFLGGVLRTYDAAGKATAVSTVKFDGPSSVSRALGRAGFSSTAVVVTERNANRVSLYEPR